MSSPSQCKLVCMYPPVLLRILGSKFIRYLINIVSDWPDLEKFVDATSTPPQTASNFSTQTFTRSRFVLCYAFLNNTCSPSKYCPSAPSCPAGFGSRSPGTVLHSSAPNHHHEACPLTNLNPRPKPALPPEMDRRNPPSPAAPSTPPSAPRA